MKIGQVIARLDGLAAQGAEFETLLEAAVHGVHQMDSRFHWTGIYELFPDNVLRLGPFFPALIFAWQRNATTSVLGAVTFHAACNILGEILFALYRDV